MQISEALKLVVPIRYNGEEEKPDPKNPGKSIKVAIPSMWAYHTAISQNTFREHHRIIAAAKQEIFGTGDDYKFASEVGITTADLALLDAARDDAAKRGTEDMGPALLGEIQRLTMISVPAQAPQQGFTFTPAENAIRGGIITEDEWHDLECVLVYLRFYDGDACAAKENSGLFGAGLRWIDDIVLSYGVRRILDDVDARRDFRGPTSGDGNPSILHSCLDYVTGEGFGETLKRHGIKAWDSPQAYRDRHFLEIIRALARRSSP